MLYQVSFSKFVLPLSLIVLFSVCGMSGVAQSEEVNSGERVYPTENNSVLTTIGSLIFVNQASFSYERKVWQKNNFRTRARLTYGTYLNNGLDISVGNVYHNYLGISAVQQISLFEFNIGAAYANYDRYDEDLNVNIFEEEIIVTEDQSGIFLFGNVGMRFDINQFIIRFGIGNLNLAFFGLGFSF